MPTSNAAARNAVLAARQAAAKNPQHPAVWQPWETTISQAEARLKAETASALATLDKRAAEAAQLLNVAYATAASPAAALRKAAWDAWHRYMAMADDLLTSIVKPATEAYDREIAEAAAAYDAALGDAVSAYNKLLAAANRAKTEAAGLAKVS